MAKDEDDTKESIKKNWIVLQKTTLNGSLMVEIHSHDMKTKDLIKEARKQFDDLWEKGEK